MRKDNIRPMSVLEWEERGQVQQVGCLPCILFKEVQFLASQMVPGALPGIIFECRTRNNPWALLGMPPNQKIRWGVGGKRDTCLE